MEDNVKQDAPETTKVFLGKFAAQWVGILAIMFTVMEMV